MSENNNNPPPPHQKSELIESSEESSANKLIDFMKDSMIRSVLQDMVNPLIHG